MLDRVIKKMKEKPGQPEQEVEEQSVPSTANENPEDETRQKRRRLDNTAAPASSCQPPEGASDDQPFTFSAQGQWVATYYDDSFCVGQVIEVCSPQSGTVQYLERTTASGGLKWMMWL